MISRSFTPAVVVVVLAAGVLAGCTASNHNSGGAASADQQTAAVAAPIGVFAASPNAPAAFKGVAGSATLTDASDGGSDAAIALRGLKPNTSYLAHVHAGTCDQPDPGGPHFRFDPNGSDTPPNEIHLKLTSNATGGASANTHSRRAVADGEAGSIVVHQDTPATGSVASTEKPKAAPGHEHHARSLKAGSTSGAGGHSHSHSEKIACAALPQRAPTAAASSAAAPSRQPAESRPLAIRVDADEPVGGAQELAVRKGQRVRFTVASDKPEEVHVHAYDIVETVGPAKPARFDFAADIEGVFEVELERSSVQILRLTVSPR